MCARVGRQAFEHMTGKPLPPGNALEKFRNLKKQ
jgi:hypothetical protein